MTRAHKRLRLLASILTFGMVFAPLGCVSRVADTIISGITLGGATGLFGPASPLVTPLGAGWNFLTDLFRLIR